MHIGTQNFGIQNHAAQQATLRATQAQNHEHSGSSGRGERLVARHDADNDGKLSTAELQDTRFGKKISVDRFAQLDRNDDGQLEAGELNRRGRHHDHAHDHHKIRTHDGPSNIGPSHTEQALVAKFADLLAAPADPADQGDLGDDIAKALLARLDKDDSGGLNSEEIAGSKLAEKIGSGFYELDGDKNGALDTAELSAFITSQFLGADQSDKDTGVTPVSALAADTVVAQEAEIVAEVAPAEDAPAASQPPQSSYADSLRASFEVALEVLQKGNEQQQAALSVVRTLYAEANKAFG